MTPNYNTHIISVIAADVSSISVISVPLFGPSSGSIVASLVPELASGSLLVVLGLATTTHRRRKQS
jgi:hypothetical protein